MLRRAFWSVPSACGEKLPSPRATSKRDVDHGAVNDNQQGSLQGPTLALPSVDYSSPPEMIDRGSSAAQRGGSNLDPEYVDEKSLLSPRFNVTGDIGTAHPTAEEKQCVAPATASHLDPNYYSPATLLASDAGQSTAYTAARASTGLNVFGYEIQLPDPEGSAPADCSWSSLRSDHSTQATTEDQSVGPGTFQTGTSAYTGWTNSMSLSPFLSAQPLGSQAEPVSFLMPHQQPTSNGAAGLPPTLSIQSLSMFDVGSPLGSVPEVAPSDLETEGDQDSAGALEEGKEPESSRVVG